LATEYGGRFTWSAVLPSFCGATTPVVPRQPHCRVF